ncbi:hypothetical protein ACFY9C_11160 [Streptomyces filamentosus]|uniref:hypothetical protein n=1 Tax=Streptomyces filamentosus TaxID=67294 RepID=UPI0036E4D8ED
MGAQRPTAVSPAPSGQDRSFSPVAPAAQRPAESAYPWKNQSRSRPGGRSSWSSSRLPACGVRPYSSRASARERRIVVLRSPPPAGSSQGRLHLATTGSPSDQAMAAASSALVGSSVRGWGRPRAAQVPASAALSTTLSNCSSVCSGSRKRPVSSARRRARARALTSSSGTASTGSAGPPVISPAVRSSSAASSVEAAVPGRGRTERTYRERETGPSADSTTAWTGIPARPRERAAPSVPWWKGFRSSRTRTAGTRVSKGGTGMAPSSRVPQLGDEIL